jgi:hypothetical protein
MIKPTTEPWQGEAIKGENEKPTQDGQLKRGAKAMPPRK